MHKISQRNMQKKSWGIMSTIFTQVGAKCPWGILSWGILSVGQNVLGAKCPLAANILYIFLFLGQADRDNLQKQIDTNAANGDKSSDELREMIRHVIVIVIV